MHSACIRVNTGLLQIKLSSSLYVSRVEAKKLQAIIFPGPGLYYWYFWFSGNKPPSNNSQHSPLPQTVTGE